MAGPPGLYQSLGRPSQSRAGPNLAVPFKLVYYYFSAAINLEAVKDFPISNCVRVRAHTLLLLSPISPPSMDWVIDALHRSVKIWPIFCLSFRVSNRHSIASFSLVTPCLCSIDSCSILPSSCCCAAVFCFLWSNCYLLLLLFTYRWM